ncbi:unnamed protein product [Closterium sp. Yama58-4]|nr:unnamed protein product [Closterium sp. Yama58-4]
MRALLQSHALVAPPGIEATAPITRRRALACASGTRLSTLVSGPALGLRLAFLPSNRATRSAPLPIRADSSPGNRAATPAGFSAFRSSVQPTLAPESSQTTSSAAFASVSSGANFAASIVPAVAAPKSFQDMAAAAGAPVFTPWSSLFGGVLIGVASTLHLLLSGRIMGASGIINGAISGASDWPFRVVFLASMLAVGCAAHLALPSAFGAPTFPAPAQDPVASVLLPAVAGVLAGFGSQPPKAAAPGAVPPILLLSSMLSGAVFAVGLTFSGMLNPAKVKAFLDPIHGWDPSLAFVMGGAVLFNLVAFHLVLKQRHPLLVPSFSLPTRKDITKELVIGSAIFGLGWGLAGFCPAPAFVSAVTGKV